MEQILTLDVPGGGQTPVFGAAAQADDPTSRPLVVIFPAMGVPAGYYQRLVDAFAAIGVNAAAVETPGQGKSTPPPGGFGHGYGALARDFFPYAVERVRDALPAGPVIAMGHSMGGHLALLHLGLTAGDKHAMDGVVLIATGTNHWKAYETDRFKILLKTQFVGVFTRLRGHWPGDFFKFGGRQNKHVIRDWATIARTGRWGARGLGEIEDALRDVEMPVLAVDVANDTFATASTLEAMVSRVPRARVTRWHYAGPEGERIDHLSWARKPGEVPQRVLDWIESDVREDA